VADRRALSADLALAGISLIWGSTFVVVKDALDDVSTILFLALRFSVAALALALIYRRKLLFGGFARNPALAGGILAGGLLIAAYFLQTHGLRYTTASKSAFITGLSIPLVPLVSSVVYRRAPRWIELAGIAIATCGMALLTVDWSTLQIHFGDVLTFGCAIGFALHIVVVGEYSRRTGFEMLSLIQIAVAAAAALLSFWWMETPRLVWSVSVAGAIGVTGLLATALAFTVMTWAQQNTTPTHTALMFALEPVFASLTSYVLLGEVLGPVGAAGAGLILAGVLLVELKPAARAQHPSK
jgi:drug/metabolite transporter (DMT)-like permease